MVKVTTLSNYQTFSADESERRQERMRWGEKEKGGGGGEEGGVELVEVGGGVSERWERREVYVIADRKEEEEEDVTSIFTKIITFRLLVCPERLTNFYFFWLKLLVAISPVKIYYVRKFFIF